MSVLSNPPQVIFSGNDLNQVPGLIITSRDIFGDGNRKINSQKLARTDKSVLTTAEYTTKTVNISVALVCDTRQDLEASFDMLNSLVQDIEAPLQITQNGQTRNYTATLASTTIITTDVNGNPGAVGGMIEEMLVFICSDPFGYDTAQSTLIDATTLSTSTATIQMVVGGSFKVAPTITILVNAVTGGTGANIQLINAQTGLGVTIARDFIAGDIIGIDGGTGIVTVNGVLFNVTGKIPFFVPGLRQLGYVDNFSTRSVTISAVYTKKYV